MPRSFRSRGFHGRQSWRHRFLQENLIDEIQGSPDGNCQDEINVGCRLRQLRVEQGHSIRALAELSGLNVNTLSLIENGKSSPSVGTLQQLANALEVPVTVFFEADTPGNNVIYMKSNRRPKADFTHGMLEDLGAGILSWGMEPFIVSLDPETDSGQDAIVHTGQEFVFCLEGQIEYTIDNDVYVLEAGDSLLFESHLPHRWRNLSTHNSHSILVLCPSDEHDQPAERHFMIE
jgi:transcriptional regulator with XRE-family HTH domain